MSKKGMNELLSKEKLLEVKFVRLDLCEGLHYRKTMEI